MKKYLKKVIIILVALLFVSGGITAYVIYSKIYSPRVILKSSKQEFFYIHTGWGMDQVINSLYEKNYITDRSLFEWLAEQKNLKKHIYPGRYRVKSRMSYNDIVNLLREGKQEPVKIRIDLLHTKAQLAGLVGNLLETDSARIMEVFSDKNFWSNHGIDQAGSFSIFIGDTYDFNWNTSAEEFFEKMLKIYNRYWSSEKNSMLSKTGLTRLQVVTLASIVEMESKKKDERSIVAGVYMNRLAKNMLLQADPTVIYAVGDFSIKRVLKKHLEVSSPYNTYKNKGLPPGPIAIPSKNSIDAVLNFTRHNYLYFCAKDDLSGYHNFAVTYDQHMLNAKKYQQMLNEKF